MAVLLDKNAKSAILTPEEVAQFFRKSTSWVYKNWEELGGRKLGGSLFFPRKEDLYLPFLLFEYTKSRKLIYHRGLDQLQNSAVCLQNWAIFGVYFPGGEPVLEA
jgi:hypothetical protein